MFFYYLRLSALSYKRNPILSSLMVLAISIGIGAYMVIFTLNYVMGGDPIPHKSDQLFHVQMDIGSPGQDRDMPRQLSYLDATALFEANQANHETMTSKFAGVLEPANAEIKPFTIDGRGATADFFTMFEIPFIYGNAWGADADKNVEQVVVLSKEVNERLFGGENSVGKSITLEENQFQVIGVIDAWNPMPKFYDVNNGAFNKGEEVFIPWALIVPLELPRSGNTNCFKAVEEGVEGFLNSECVWIQYWVELTNSNEEADYLNFINSYAQEQKSYGRFEKELNNNLLDVNEWMIEQKVMPDETRILSVLASMLLAVCLLNTIGLLLSKFLGKSGEIGVRQALGAHKGSLFIQHVIEAGFIGLIGGLLGLGVAAIGLEGIRVLLGEDMMMTEWIQLDTTVASVTIGLAITSTIVAGMYPIWRACNINPAIHLKTH
ncbi:MAG: putative ABC transport system permease protein [Pseudohongiellaceae bacterium]|jgi:putative ABC transport system permease protein